MENGGFDTQVFNDIKKEDISQPVSEREKLSFHQAARYGNVVIVQKYIQKYHGKKRKINKLNKQELSALHYAVRYGHMEVIKVLIQARAKVNIIGSDGAQPIHFAAKYFKVDKHSDATHLIRHVQPVIQAEENFINVQNDGTVLKTFSVNNGNDTSDVITYLLNNGAHVNAMDNYNQTPLNYAAVKGNLEGMAILLNWPGIDLEVIDTSGGTALHNACGNGNTDSAKLLLMSGATLMRWDNEHMNPLHYAATGDGVSILKEIIFDIEKQGGTVDNWTLKDIINDQDNQGQGILHLAVDTGHYNTCCLVIEKGANVNLCKSGFSTPLHLAAATGNTDIVKLLVASGADIESLNIVLETPLHKAALFNRPEVAKFLLETRCSVDACNQDNETPLIVAAANGNLETLQVLLEYNANLHIVDTTEKSAIFWAAEENSVEVLKLLLGHVQKSDSSCVDDLVNQMDRFENTPLHIAAEKGFKHVVELLLDTGADVDACNDEELTPLHLASMNGRKKVAMLLLNKKPSIINDEDESGNTALHLAALHGRPKLVDILIDFGASVDARNSVLWTPLDCAAAKGHTNVVLHLLDRDSPIDPIDLASTTPLHLASREGHDEVVEVLLQHGADLTLVDHTGRNALDMAVENSHRKVALAILDHPDWLSVMKNRSREGRNVTTPMRQLIKKLPDVAYLVLNKCMKLTTHLPPDSFDYKVQFYYDLLDDTYSDWTNDGDELEEDQKSIVTTGSTVEGDNVNKLTGEVQKLMERKSNHPLCMMCHYKRGELLNHPLVISLIYEKWQKFGRIVFYSKFAVYFVFLFFLTGYVLVSRPYLPAYVTSNGTRVCVSKITRADKDDALVVIFMIAGRLLVIILGSFQLFLELLQLVARGIGYVRDLTNVMEWSIYIMAIFYTIDDVDHYINTKHSCSSLHISIGSIAIFLAWIDLLLFIQKFPTLGIYVVMFTDVFKTFLKFSMTFVLFIIAFALGFFTLLGDQMRTFSTFARGIVKTTVMMIGEFDFDATFNSAEFDPPLITWFLFFIFVIIMTILLMNLMVGLAVDDIKGVLDQAVVNRVAMQVHLVLDVEKSLPSRFRQRYVMKEKTVYPNREFHWLNLMSHITTMDEIHEAVNPTKSVSDIVQEHTQSIRHSVDKLKTNFQDMNKQMKNLEQMMETLLKHSNLSNDTDDW